MYLFQSKKLKSNIFVLRRNLYVLINNFRHPEKERGNNKEIDKNNKNIKNHKEHSALYSLEELDRFNLPPLPDLSNLTIDYDNEEFLHIGHVKAIVESLGKFLRSFIW